MNQNKILSLIGLATKAGLLVSGEFSTEKAVKEGNAKLVILAKDSSDNTKKMFNNMCEYYKTPIIYYGEKVILAKAMGKEVRASLAILDEGFAKKILNEIDIENRNMEV